MADYILVCPSHRRSKIFLTKTYALLQRCNAPKPILWVKDAQDVKDYTALDLDLEIHTAHAKNIAETRNEIQDYYPLGAKLVFIDDDIKDIAITEESKKHSCKDFDALVAYAFSLCIAHGTTLWGSYPVDNPLFMKRAIRVNPCYLNGSLFGVFNSRVTVFHNYAEDFERSIKYYLKEQRVLRCEFIGLSTRYYVEKGGMQETRTEALNLESKTLLVKQFPEYLKLVEKKGRANIAFKNARGGLIYLEDMPDTF